MQVTTYKDVVKIIEKGLPRYIYLPYKIAVRVGHEVYIKLLPQERMQFIRRLVNEKEISLLELKEEDLLMSLASMVKGEENILKVKGERLTLDDIVKDNELARMGFTKQYIRRTMKKFIEAGYIEEVSDGELIYYRLTEKTLLPERPEEKFKVIAID